MGGIPLPRSDYLRPANRPRPYAPRELPEPHRLYAGKKRGWERKAQAVVSLKRPNARHDIPPSAVCRLPIKPRQRSGAITQAGRRPAVRGSGGVSPRCGKCDQSVKTLFRRKAGKVFADLIAVFPEPTPKTSPERDRGCRALSPAEGGCREAASSPSRQTTPGITSRHPQSAE